MNKKQKKEYPECKLFLRKLKRLGYTEIVPFTRHTQFNGEPCDVCGGTKLIHGMGRYIIFDSDREDDLAIFICGFCQNYTEKELKIKFDYM